MRFDDNYIKFCVKKTKSLSFSLNPLIAIETNHSVTE